jgi:hypothetical protein
MLIKKKYNLITGEKNINTRAVYFTYSLFLKKISLNQCPRNQNKNSTGVVLKSAVEHQQKMI